MGNKYNKIIFILLINIISTPISTCAVEINHKQSEVILVNNEKDKLVDKFNSLKEELESKKILDELNDLLEEVEESKMLFADKYALKSEINLYIEEIQEKVENNNVIYIKILDNLEFVIEDGVPFLKFPQIHKKYKITCSVLNKEDKKKIRTGEVENNIFKLPELEKTTTLEVAISVLNTETNKEEVGMLIEKTFEDIETPILNYVYAENGIVYLDFKDNYKLNSESAKYKIYGDSEFINIKDNKFKLNIPNKVVLSLTDLFKNQVEYEIDIKKDNSPIYGAVPGPILQKLLKGEFSIPEKGKNIIIGEKGQIINIQTMFNEIINDYLGAEDIEDIKFDSYANDIKLNELGLKEVVLRNTEGISLAIYIYTVDSIENLNLNTMKINNSIDEDKILVTNETEVDLLKYLDIENMDEGKYNSKIFVKEHGSELLHPIREKTKLEKNSNNTIEIIDILTKDLYKMNIVNDAKLNEIIYIPKYKARFNSEGIVPLVPFKQYYLDVSESHWASNAIVRLTDIGVLRGYDDRKFLPNENMTMKEFLVMFGRFVALQDPAILNPSIENRALSFEYWGEGEANNVITRIDREKLESLDMSNVSRNIRKEEVAFFIANTIILNQDTSLLVDLNDIKESQYKVEIEQLYSNQISKGMPDGSFGPEKNILRSEVVELFNNMLK